MLQLSCCRQDTNHPSDSGDDVMAPGERARRVPAALAANGAQKLAEAPADNEHYNRIAKIGFNGNQQSKYDG